MPTYDFRCDRGHVEERRVHGYDTEVIECQCGRPARRDQVPRRAAGITGFAIAPMREKRIPITDAMTALGDVQAEARKRGVDPPDFLSMAKKRAAVIQRHAPELVTGT